MSTRPATATRLPAVAAVAVAVALLLAGVASRFASSSPDGLERVADEHGLADRAADHALADSPVADYSLRGVDDEGWATGAAGVVGVVATLVLGTAVAAILHRARRPGSTGPASHGSGLGRPDADRPSADVPSLGGPDADRPSLGRPDAGPLGAGDPGEGRRPGADRSAAVAAPPSER